MEETLSEGRAPAGQKLASAREWLRRERHWVVLSLTYLAAWWVPLSWLWPLLLPGEPRPEGIDGPVSWMWHNHWGKTDSPLSFQIWVPLMVIALAWSRREEIRQSWHKLRRARRDDAPAASPIWIGLGCALLLISHLIHLSALSVLALIIIAVGVIVYTWGAGLLPVLRVPLLYWLLMISPPESLVGKFSGKMSAATGQATAWLLQKLGKPAQFAAPHVRLGNASVELGVIEGLAAGGGALICASLALMLGCGLYLRRTPLRIGLLMASGCALACLLNVLRVCAALQVRSGSTRLSGAILNADIWFLLLPTTLLVLFLDRRLDHVWQRWEKALKKRLAPLAEAWRLSSRQTERAADTSGRVVSKSVGLLMLLVSPLVWVASLGMRGIEGIFKLLASSNRWMEQSMKQAERDWKKRGKRRQ